MEKQTQVSFVVGKIGWLDKLKYQKTLYFSIAQAMSIYIITVARLEYKYAQ